MSIGGWIVTGLFVIGFFVFQIVLVKAFNKKD